MRFNAPQHRRLLSVAFGGALRGFPISPQEELMMPLHRNAFFLALTLALGMGSTASAQPKAKPLPDGSEKKTVTIYSDGTKMIGDLYLPAGFKKADTRPAVVFCNGTAGTKSGTPTQLAPRFLEAGFVFLAFDYRGWGETGNSFRSSRCQSPTRRARSPLRFAWCAGRWISLTRLRTFGPPSASSPASRVLIPSG